MLNHSVSRVHAETGLLRFDAAIAGQRQTVTLTTDAPIVPAPESMLAACLMPAMRAGGALHLPGAFSPQLLSAQVEFQALQREWSRSWGSGGPPLEVVDVRATPGPVEMGEARGRTAAFFSGGVDSWSTLLEHPEITDLIFVRGFDLPARDTALSREVETALRGVAAQTGRTLHLVSTDVRSLADPVVRWEMFFGCGLATVALAMAPLFRRIYVAGDSDYEVNVPMGANPAADHLWSTERMTVVHDGGRFSRVDRLRRITSDPLVASTLRVCWENHGGAYNCGRCRKCLMTMVTLEALGVRERFVTFPRELDLERVAAAHLERRVSVTLWQDVLDMVREAGRSDLERPVARAVAAGKATVGVPPSWRRRRCPGPRPTVRTAVVVPVHAQPHFLASAVRSAMRQDLGSGVGIVIVDDGCPYPSTHATATALRDAAPEQVLYVRQPNRGLSAARNTGIRSALARWPQVEAVLPLDADNMLSPATLALMWATLEAHPAAGWAFPSLDLFGLERGAWSLSDPYCGYKQLFENQSDAASLIRRELFDAGLWFDESMLKGYEDWELFVRATHAGFAGVHVGPCGLRYRRRPYSMFSEAVAQLPSITQDIRARNQAAYAPRALAQREHDDVPRFALVRCDRSDVLLATCVDLEPRVVSLASFAAAVRGSRGGAVVTSGAVPAVSVLTDADTLAWLDEKRLLAGLLLRAQGLLRAHPVVALRLGRDPAPDVLQIRVAVDSDVPQRPHALIMRSSTLNEHMGSSAARPLRAGPVFEVHAGIGFAPVLPEPGEQDLLDAVATASTLATAETALGVSCLHGQWAERMHVDRFETTLPWAGRAGRRDVLVIAPRLSCIGAQRGLMKMLQELRVADRELVLHLVLTSDGFLEVVDGDDRAAWSTITAVDGHDPDGVLELVTLLVSGADIVVNADSSEGYGATTRLADHDRPITVALVDGALGPESQHDPAALAARFYDRFVDVYLVSCTTAAHRLAALDAIPDKVFLAPDGAVAARTLLDAVAIAAGRRRRPLAAIAQDPDVAAKA
jgi:Glycosyl transferase family 2